MLHADLALEVLLHAFSLGVQPDFQLFHSFFQLRVALEPHLAVLPRSLRQDCPLHAGNDGVVSSSWVTPREQHALCHETRKMLLFNHGAHTAVVSSGSRFTAPGADYVPKLAESAQLPLSIHPHAAMPVVRVGADKQGRTAGGRNKYCCRPQVDSPTTAVLQSREQASGRERDSSGTARYNPDPLSASHAVYDRIHNKFLHGLIHLL